MRARNSFLSLIIACLFFSGTILVARAENPPITQGTVVASIFGPNHPTPETILPGPPNRITNFWVTLKIIDVRGKFGMDLKGKTIKLPTCEFDKKLIGQTVPLLLSYNPGGYQISDYWLMCTNIEIARLTAQSEEKK